MMRFFFLLVVVLVGARADASASARQRELIINGDPVSPTDHQFFVRSAFDNIKETDDMLCGASLIHSDIIVTAAHCHGGFNFGVMAYDPDTEKFTQYKAVDLQIAYPRYYENVEIINYDLLILRLESPITNVEPIELNSDPQFPLYRSINGIVGSYVLEGLGVGITETGKISRGLEVGYFNAMPNGQCGQRLGNAPNVIMTGDVMCADPYTDDSICAGDSGGPLAARIPASGEAIAASRAPWDDNPKPVLVGVTTFGNDCKVDEIPDGFSRISFYYEWINKQICNYSRDPPSDCLDYFESDEYSEFLASQDTSNPMENQVRITMKFQHDLMAEQTTFVFRNTDTNKIEYVGPQYVPERAQYVESEFLLPVPGNYLVEIYDSLGDGLKNPDFAKDFPQGSWTISAEYSNGARIEDLASGDHNFERLQTRSIQLPRWMKYDGPTSAPSVPVLPWSDQVFDAEPQAQAEAQALESSSAPLTISAWGLAISSLVWSAFLWK